MSLTNADVQDILALLDASSFNELHLKTDRFTLHLRRSDQGGWVQESSVTGSLPTHRPQQEEAAKPVMAVASPATSGLIEVPSPLLGTFYRAPKPGAPPYIEIGSEVEAETVVGLIETMKLMNSVYAGCRGRVAEICIKDAQFAEQGTVLLRIESTP
jgi:acetyl-CoA carboxylase biotin carboxyl carrier protein